MNNFDFKLILIIIYLISANCSTGVKITSKNFGPSVKDINSVFITHNLTKKSIAEFFHKSFEKNKLASTLGEHTSTNIDSLRYEASKNNNDYLLIFEEGESEFREERRIGDYYYSPNCSPAFMGAKCVNELKIVNVSLYKVSDTFLYWSAKVYPNNNKGRKIVESLISKMKEDQILAENFKKY